MKRISRKFLRRSGKTNQHHLLAKARGGTKTGFNLFLLDDNRHAAFHLLFGTRTLREAALVLLRADRKRRNLYRVREEVENERPKTRLYESQPSV